MSALSRGSTARGRRDPITSLSRFCEMLALGLVATSLFLPFTNGLNHPDAPHISLDYFPDLLQKSAVVAVHTRVPWIVLAILSTMVAVVAYRVRYSPKPHRLLALAPLAVVLVIAVHAAALGYLHSQGVLKIEVHGPAPAGLDALHIPAGTLPGPMIHGETISRLNVREGTPEQWQLLFAGDLLFSAPILLAWILRRALATKAPAHE